MFVALMLPHILFCDDCLLLYFIWCIVIIQIQIWFEIQNDW
jgi:hypothetical protein